MGRRKLELKRIENKSSRQVTFSKRRGRLMKKAKQLSVVCDAQVAVVVFSSGGRLYDFCSDNRKSWFARLFIETRITRKIFGVE